MVNYVHLTSLPLPRQIPDPIIFDSSSLIRAFETELRYLENFKDKGGTKKYIKKFMKRRDKSYEVVQGIFGDELKNVIIPFDVLTEVRGVITSSHNYDSEAFESWDSKFFETDNHVVLPQYICENEIFTKSNLHKFLRDCKKDLTQESKGEIAVLCTAWKLAEQGFVKKNHTNNYSSISIVSEDRSYFNTNLENKLYPEFFRNFGLRSSKFKIYEISQLHANIKMPGI